MNLFCGQRIGKLTVIAPDVTKTGRRSYWLVRCDCGEMMKSMRADVLQQGRAKSCGCMRGKYDRHKGEVSCLPSPT